MALFYITNSHYRWFSYQKAIQLNPNYVDAWNSKEIALYNLGKYEEAVNWLNSSLIFCRTELMWMNVYNIK